jgi:rod shape-determining protein MreD
VRPTAVGVVAVVAAASFVGSSLYALSGVLLSDPAVGIGGVLQVVLISLALDVLLTPIVMPGLLRLFTRLDPQQAVA